MIEFLAALGVLFVAIIVATAVILFAASLSHPEAEVPEAEADEAEGWDGQNHPLDDGTWSAQDSELAQEAARYRRGIE